MVLKTIPGMEIVVPGTSSEFDLLFRQAYSDGKPTYYRLSESENLGGIQVKFGKANVVKQGKRGTVIVVGPLLDIVMLAVKDLDVTVLYYTTIYPFDNETLQRNCPTQNVVLCEPYYSGGLSADIHEAMSGKAIQLTQIGVPHTFLTTYGKFEDQMKATGLTTDSIRNKVVSSLQVR